MKHGRPEWIHEFSPLHPVQGWRRCHAHRVWSAIQAVVAYVDLWLAWRDQMQTVKSQIDEIHALVIKKNA